MTSLNFYLARLPLPFWSREKKKKTKDGCRGEERNKWSMGGKFMQMSIVCKKKSFRFRFQYANYSKSLYENFPTLPRCRLKNKERVKLLVEGNFCSKDSFLFFIMLAFLIELWNVDDFIQWEFCPFKPFGAEVSYLHHLNIGR